RGSHPPGARVLASRAARREAGEPRLDQEGPEALRFGDGELPPPWGGPVGAPALISAARRDLHDEPLLQHALDGGVERRRAQAHPSVGEGGDLLHEGVPVAFVVGQGNQDVEHRLREGQHLLQLALVAAAHHARYYIDDRYTVNRYMTTNGSGVKM